jgi:hypothetical protein
MTKLSGTVVACISAIIMSGVASICSGRHLQFQCHGHEWGHNVFRAG